MLAGLVVIAAVTSAAWPSAKPIVFANPAELLTIDPADICRAYKPPTFNAATQMAEEDALPIDITITPALRLIDHNGERRGPADLFDERLSFVFFGYASCEGVCLLAIPAIADAAAILSAEGHNVQPTLITIDPARDTPAFMKSQLLSFNPDFVGLTGPEAALTNARRMFHIQANPVFEDAKGTVFQHGSFIYP